MLESLKAVQVIESIDVQGRLSNGGTAAVVPKTLAFQFGGGSSSIRTWPLTPAQPVRKP